MTELSGIYERRGLLPRWLGDHDGFLAALRRNDFSIGVTEERRFVELIARLSTAGIDLSDPRQALPWLGPVLCRKASDQALLPQLVNQWAARNTDHQESKKQEPDEPVLANSLSTEINRNTRRTLFLAGAAAVLLLLLLSVGVYLFYGDAVTALFIDQPVVPPPNQPAPIENLSQALPKSDRGLVYASIACLIPVIMAFGLVLYRRHRRLVIARGSVSASARSTPIQVEHQKLFSSRALRRTFQVLRQHSPVASNEINVERTIRATIRAGGLFELRYGTRPALPEYVLLYDETSALDHMSLIVEGLVGRLNAERISVSCYSYHRDPQRVRKIGKKPQFMAFAEVAAHHPGQRLLILTGTLEIDVRRHETWLADLDSWGAVAIMVPDPAGISTQTGRILNRFGISVYEATSNGLEQLGHEISLGALNQARPLARGSRSSAGFFGRIENDRHALLRTAAPEPDFVNGLIWELRNWLGPEGFVWFGACAVYPAIHPNHTAYFGTHLLDAGKQPLASDARLARLAGLPWFRYGFMPNWLRRAVRNALPLPRIEEILRVCFALNEEFKFTSSDANDAMRLFDKDNLSALQAVKELILGNPRHSLNDQVFLGAIDRKVEDLALDAPTSLRHKMRRRVEPVEAAIMGGGIALGIGYFLISSATLPFFERFAWLAGLSKGGGIGATCLALWMQFGGATGLGPARSDRIKRVAARVAGLGVLLTCVAFVLDGEIMSMFAMMTAAIAWLSVTLDRILPRTNFVPPVRRITDLAAAGTGQFTLGVTMAALLQSINCLVVPLTMREFEVPPAFGGTGKLPDILMPVSYTVAIMIAVTSMSCLALAWGVVASLGLRNRRSFALASAMLLGALISFGLSMALSPYAMNIVNLFADCTTKDCASKSKTISIVIAMALWLGELGLPLGAIVWLGRQRLWKLARFGPWVIAGYLASVPILLLTATFLIGAESLVPVFLGAVLIVFGLLSRSLVPFIGFCRSRSLPGKFRFGLTFKCFGFYWLTFCLAPIPATMMGFIGFHVMIVLGAAIFAVYGFQWIALSVACFAYVRREALPNKKDAAVTELRAAIEELIEESTEASNTTSTVASTSPRSPQLETMAPQAIERPSR
jgi:hypothetical protein